MQDSLEHIIKDLYALDPSLQKDDTLVRALVSELVLAKPATSVDGVFVRRLREQLVAVPVAAPVVTKAIPSPWLMYFTPVAAVAVLLLMLVPNHKNTSLPTGSPAMQSEMYMEAADEADAMKRSAPAIEEASMMMISDSAPVANTTGGDNTFVVSAQRAGAEVLVEYLSISTPSFVVVETSGAEAQMLGASELLYPGTVPALSVPLLVATEPGQIYFVTLYQDDGDGIFSRETDYLVYDSMGTVVQQPFSATAAEAP